MTQNVLTDREDNISFGNEAIRIYVRDPTDRGRVLRESNRDILFAWCRENCRGRFWIGMGFGQFELEEDAVAFSLRWK